MLGLLLACGDPPPPVAAPPVETTPRPAPDTGDAGPTGDTARGPSTCEVPASDGTSLCLSEVQTDDDSTLPAGVGRFPDWVELWNRGPEALDPARILVVVGDHPAQPLSGPPIPPGGLGLWLADDTEGPGHLPFGLSDQGERIEVFVDGRQADVWDVPAMAGDTAWARQPSGAVTQVCAPSPGLPNPESAPCADPREALYARGTVSDLRLYVGEEGRAILGSSQMLSYYPEVPARLVFATPAGAGEFPEVQVSLKGGYGSFRNQLCCQKPSLKIDLDAVEPRRWRGLRKLQLNNDVQDQTFTREHLTYTLFRAVGVPAPRVAYARVWIDDEYFGLYSQIEPVDSDFLEDWTGDGSGHLLEAAYGPDFDPGDEAAFEYDSGPDEAEGRARIREVSDLIWGSPWDEATYATLRTLVDMDEWMTNMAVEAAVWHWDGYWTENNYYVYEVPGTGLLQIVPHGTDQTWTDGWPTAWDGNNRSAVYQLCLAVPSCAATYRAKVLAVADAVDALALEPVLDELLAITTPEWNADPRIENRCCRDAYVDATRQRIRTVSTSLRDLAAAH